MNIIVQFNHHQWYDIRKALRATKKKFTQNLSLTKCATNNKNRENSKMEEIYSENENDGYRDNRQYMMLMKDTCRNTRRKFYLSQKRREISVQMDEDFYSQLQSRRDQVQKQRILYSNITAYEKAINQIKTPKLNQNRQTRTIRSDSHQGPTSLKIGQLKMPHVPEINSANNQRVNKQGTQNYFFNNQKEQKKQHQRSKSFWSNVKSTNSDSNITQILKQRLKKKDDLTLDISFINYDSLSLINQTKTPTCF